MGWFGRCRRPAVRAVGSPAHRSAGEQRSPGRCGRSRHAGGGRERDAEAGRCRHPRRHSLDSEAHCGHGECDPADDVHGESRGVGGRGESGGHVCDFIRLPGCVDFELPAASCDRRPTRIRSRRDRWVRGNRDRRRWPALQAGQAGLVHPQPCCVGPSVADRNASPVPLRITAPGPCPPALRFAGRPVREAG